MPPRIAVVGCGPRALGALEALAEILPSHARPLVVDVFEPVATPGAGPNFDPSESDVCLLNIPMRDIDLRPPNASKCGGLADWLGDAARNPNAYPTRAELGRYLKARYDDLAAHPALSLSFRTLQAQAVEESGVGWSLRSGDEWFGPYSEVLLTLGQPEVKPDDQLAEWRTHERSSAGVLAQAYPARDLAKRAEEWRGRTVAVRGLALSAFDVIRTLTVAQGGRFEGGRYIASGREPARILPFSLDGRPPFPKPATEEVDAWFDPTEAETADFLHLMTRAAEASPEEARRLIDAALLPVVRRILSERGRNEDDAAVADWLATEWSSPGDQEGGGLIDVLRDGIAMADGQSPCSIGFAVGQVWRKWQNEVRKGFNPAATSPETAERLIGFDESLKRYSYGPPVASSRELAALIEAGIVGPELSADPAITLIEGGWKLTAGDRDATAEVMVDGVLPSPDLSTVTDPLVAGLVEDGRLCAVANGLGCKIAPDGTILGNGDRPSKGLSFLGRLALGSVIAVDSLHDCFGAAPLRWAEAVAERIGPADGAADP